MESIKIKIERSKDGHFWGYAENIEGVTGGGETVEKCKEDVLKCIETLKTIEGNIFSDKKETEYNLIFV